MVKPVITSIDVARLANVSQSAVSRTFTPGASVSTRTRQKVLEAADMLGYRPNALARAMISGKSSLVAMVVAYMENQFNPLVVEKLSRTLQNKGYHVLLFTTDPGKQDEIVSRLLSFQVEGIIMASTTLSQNLARVCADSGIPVIMLNRFSRSSLASRITSDNIAGGQLAADHLLDGGYRSIAYLAGAEDSSTNRDRENGFLQGLKRRGASLAARAVGGYDYRQAVAATRHLLSKKKRPDAIFAANDHMAFAALDVIRHEFGLSVPDQMAVVGYGDVPGASWDAYGLTTIEQNADEMIDAATRILLDQIRERKVRRRAIVLPARLVVRRSTRSAA